MNVAIFGGSFDPVHSGHLEIIDYLSNHYDLVIVVPTTIRYYKKNVCMFSFNHRYETIKEKVEQPLGNIEVWDIERNVPDTWRYIDTLEKITKNFDDSYEFTTVIGSDSLIDFEKWENYDKILEQSKLLVIERPNYPIEKHNFDFEVVDSINNDMSSTEQRKILNKMMDDDGFEDYLIDIGWTFNTEELDFCDVRPGMVLYDRDEDKLGTIFAKGNLKDLTKYDFDNIIVGAISDDPDNANGDAVAYYLKNDKAKTAVALYGECGTTFCLKEGE